jgi:UDP:flavonoid glycosyltransferase YjiC (YdhE family)
MRVLLAPHGSRGDVQPMLALARALRDAGHDAAFVAPSNFVPWLRSHGFAAEPNGIDVEALLQQGAENLQSLRWQLRHLTGMIETLFTSLAPASEGADLVVGSGIQLAAPSIAEWRDVPCAYASFCPCALPSARWPPPPVKIHSLPRWLNRLLWDVGGPITSLVLRGPINRGRSALGLRPVDDVLSHVSGDLTLVAADRDLAPFADDMPDRAVGTDAWIAGDDGADLDPRVDAFLRADPAPVYVGFGSMVAPRAAQLAETTIAAVHAVGRAAIVAGGWAGLDRYLAQDDGVLVAATLPHGRVLPRVAAAIHHGGAGTTTAAARAGAPQVILPHILDQFFWARRIAELGIGPRAIPVNLVTADVLAERVEAAVADPAIRARAAALAPAIRARNGAADAVSHLERLAGG